MVENEVELSFAQLLALPLEESTTTLTCVSNEVGGNLISNATWLGYPIRHLLAQAKPTSKADMVLSRSQDGWTASTPLEALTDDRNAILAVGMNGQPLPLEHGYPVRMVVPGLYGYVSATKWVVELDVTRFDQVTSYWTDRGWSERGPVKLSSRIDVPSGGASVKAGDVVVAGVAWSQHVGVSRVQVQVDGRFVERRDPRRCDLGRHVAAVEMGVAGRIRAPHTACPGDGQQRDGADIEGGGCRSERRDGPSRDLGVGRLTGERRVDAMSEEQRSPAGPLVEPGPALTAARLERYSRTLALPGFGDEAQRRIRAARVLVIGAGGLGSAVIPALAAAGFGTIGVVDADAVESSNLPRQTIHTPADVGRSKVASARDTITELDSETRIVPVGAMLDSVERSRTLRRFRSRARRERQLSHPVPRR